jgi:membrane-associated protease RseP (regulator of RpoE activity)
MKKSTIVFTMSIAIVVIISIFIQVPQVFSQYPEKPKSRLGVKGEMGFIIAAIEPGSAIEQAGLKPGDIITNTSLSGQITSAEQLQKDVATSVPGAPIEITYRRFNPVTRSFDERTVTVRIMPFPDQSQSKVKVTPANITNNHRGDFAQTSCSWCCSICIGYLPGE